MAEKNYSKGQREVRKHPARVVLIRCVWSQLFCAALGPLFGQASGGDCLEPVKIVRLSSVGTDAHKDTPRIEVLSVSDTGRRRRLR